MIAGTHPGTRTFAFLYWQNLAPDLGGDMSCPIGTCPGCKVKKALEVRLYEGGTSEPTCRSKYHCSPLRLEEMAEQAWAARNGHGMPEEPVNEERQKLRAAELIAAFPLDSIPVELASVAREGAAALPCPPDFIAVHLLAICGAVIGRSRALEVKPGWIEGPRIWSAVVADTGEKKSPALGIAHRPLAEQQNQLQRQQEENQSAYESKHARYEVELAVWMESVKKAAKAGTPVVAEKPVEPEEPKMPQLFTTDATVEGMSRLLHENPRGVILLRDELTGWARAMDQYHGGKGSDRESWLSFWSGAPVLINRKGWKQPVYLPNPFVSVTGCLPPGVLGDFTDERGQEDGFIHRILFAYPEPVTVEWTDASISFKAVAAYEELLDRLAKLAPIQSEYGHEVPQVVEFTSEGKAAWVRWVNTHYAEFRDPLFSDALRGPWAKMDGYCASYALIIQAIRFVMGGSDTEDVDAVSVQAAVALIDYHKNHARRVYPMLRASEEDVRVMRVVRWIEKQPGRATTARDVQHYKVGGVQRTDEAKRLLADLEARGYGEVKAGERKDTVRFALHPRDTPTVE
jgi:hypothetical protein